MFGIGGIQPYFANALRIASTNRDHRIQVAPVPWLADAPRGATVWRSGEGVTTAAWAASRSEAPQDQWHIWVNVTVPAASSGAQIMVMLPRTAKRGAVCAWECGAETPIPAAFTTEWIAFDAAGNGHAEYHAVLPPPSASATAPLPADLAATCSAVWHKGTVRATPPGIDGGAKWADACPGFTMFPSPAWTLRAARTQSTPRRVKGSRRLQLHAEGGSPSPPTFLFTFWAQDEVTVDAATVL